MTGFLVATGSGIIGIGTEIPTGPGRRIRHLSTGAGAVWAIDGDDAVWRDGDVVATVGGARANCLLATGDEVLVGASAGRLYRLDPQPVVDPGFADAPGRDEWYTPWGGPADVRWLAAGADGTIYANVHVGGVLRRRPGGGWEQTMDIDADAHQVAAHPTDPALVVAATARGLAVSEDGTDDWRFVTTGLRAVYCRAVAVTAAEVFVSASTGPGGGRAGLYRMRLGDTALERCDGGLPEWFSGNVDSGCVAASEEAVAVADPDGTVWVSDDAGDTWRSAAEGLDRVAGVVAV